jgi:hypothetical protein
MSARKVFPILLTIGGVFLALAIALFISPTPAMAHIPLQTVDGNKCVTCHEDLYYLHDTGKAYCLQDAPMDCIGCHGGDPDALTKEEAHFKRDAHPVIGDDNKKCYVCHPAEADNRLEKFRQVAGISEIKWSPTCEPDNAPVPSDFPESQPEKWVPTAQAITLFAVAGMMLIVYVSFKIRN